MLFLLAARVEFRDILLGNSVEIFIDRRIFKKTLNVLNYGILK